MIIISNTIVIISMNEVRQSSAKVFLSSSNPLNWNTPTSCTSISCDVAPFVLRSNDTTHFVIGIECLSIPLAVYMVNVNNNVVELDGVTITIPEGNYTVTTLTTYLNSQTGVTGITWAFNANNTNNNKFTVTYPGITFFNGNAYTLLGYVPSNIFKLSHTFDNTVNLAYTTGIQVRLDNIQTDNRDSQTGTSSIIARIPITVAPFKVLQYFNAQPFYTTIANRYINNIKISLLDDEYRPLVLVGNPQWNITLRIDFADKVQSVREQKLIESLNTNMLTARK